MVDNQGENMRVAFKRQFSKLFKDTKVYYLPVKNRDFPLFTFRPLSFRAKLHNWILNTLGI